MSALPPKADILRGVLNVFVPEADKLPQSASAEDTYALSQLKDRTQHEPSMRCAVSGFAGSPVKLSFMRIIAAILLMLSLAAPVAAGPLEDADAAMRRHDYKTALRLIRPLAEQGDANAQYNLGVFYDNGLGVPQTVSGHTCG
jgi:TPR repeat protein